MWKVILLSIVLVAAYLSWPSANVVIQTPWNEQGVNNSSNTGDTHAHVSLEGITERMQSEKERQTHVLEQQANEFKHHLLLVNQQGQGNMQAWLEPIWRQCQQLGHSGCAQWQDEMAQFLTAEEQHWLAQALANFNNYQQEMQSYTADASKSTVQRFNELKQLREHYLGEQSEAIFGLENNFSDYQFQYDELRQQASSFSVEERMQRLQELHSKAALGNLQQELLGADTQYQQALNMLDGLSAEEQQQWRKKLQQQYFGDKAEEVARYEERQQQHQIQQQSYQQALEQLQQRWQSQTDGLNSQGYQQELQALRARMFN